MELANPPELFQVVTFETSGLTLHRKNPAGSTERRGNTLCHQKDGVAAKSHCRRTSEGKSSSHPIASPRGEHHCAGRGRHTSHPPAGAPILWSWPGLECTPSLCKLRAQEPQSHLPLGADGYWRPGTRRLLESVAEAKGHQSTDNNFAQFAVKATGTFGRHLPLRQS